jgi:hypothetical protein
MSSMHLVCSKLDSLLSSSCTYVVIDSDVGDHECICHHA